MPLATSRMTALTITVTMQRTASPRLTVARQRATCTMEKENAFRKNAGSTWTEYVYGARDTVEAEYNGSSYPVQYIYAGDRLIAEYTNNTTEFVHGDHLGSTRLVTAVNQSIIDSLDYLPYGTQISGDTATTHKLTDKERDSESGLDNFGARYNASSLGRFMTPDWSSTPAAVPFADPANPQSLNLYSYVINNPLNRTDPLGHNWFCTSGSSSNCGHWEWHKGSEYTDKDGNKFTSKYTGLLSAQANGTDKKTGATLYKLTLYDQNKAVATGTGFSGGNGMPAIKDGNYMIRLDIRDPNGPNSINPNSALNNPPAFFGIQKMHDITDSQGTWDVVGAYGPIRARLNPMSGKDDGDYFHGQSNGHGYTHGCLCYGTDTRFAEYMWNNMPRTTASSHRRSDGSAMKKIILFVLWSCAAFAQGAKPTGAWLPVNVKWEHAPASVNPKLETGATSVLYFDERHFALVGCVVNRESGRYVISHGDGQVMSLGGWDGQIPGHVKYRLVSRTVQRVGETLPGPWREEKLESTPKGYLLFEGKLYRHVEDLEPSVRELLHGTAEAAWK